MGYACKILADSISLSGHRVTSFEATFPRIVLAELNTHCVLARNSASSRATPVPARVAAVDSAPFVPQQFGKNQSGMQPGEALRGDEATEAERIWMGAAYDAVAHATRLANAGVHKQYANRLIEPYSWHTAVITATDLDNFFHLRVSPLAQGEIRTIAEMMFEARNASTPKRLSHTEWHLPYVDAFEEGDLLNSGYSAEKIQKISVARCARVSFLRQGEIREPQKDIDLYDEKLLRPGHMSPLEHVLRPMAAHELRATRAFDISLNDGPMLRVGNWAHERVPKVGDAYGIGAEIAYITAVRGPLHYSAKFNGWISRRSYVPGEWDILGSAR